MKRTLHGVVALVAVLLLQAPSAWAQVDRATLTGIVKDPSDAIIAKAQVTVTSLATGAMRPQRSRVEKTTCHVNRMDILLGDHIP